MFISAFCQTHVLLGFQGETSPMKEAEAKDFWALDFRRKLAAQQQIGK